MPEKKLKIQFENEILQDRYQIGRVLDVINFEVNTICTAMQFTLVAHYSDILVNVGIEAHSLEQDLIVPMFSAARPTILRGNLIGPKIEISGLLLKNWGDRALIVKQNDVLVTICLCEHRESILMGNLREKSHMDGILRVILTINFERTILSALSFTKARIPDDIISVGDKLYHISDMLRMTHISVNALKTNAQGEPKMEFSKNRGNLNKILLSQLLQKHQFLNNDDVVQIQLTSNFLTKIKQNVMKGINDKFAIFENVLYHVATVLGVKMYKLCLPTSIASQII